MKRTNQPLILIRGGGDLASGVAVRLFRSGFQIVISEISAPLTIRRFAAFAEAVYESEWQVEGISSVLCQTALEAERYVESGRITVMVDPAAEAVRELNLLAAVDGRMLKTDQVDILYPGLFSIGLGPGFDAGVNCDAVVETNRGAALGRVYWHGSAQADTGEPESVGNFGSERVLRAPIDGIIKSDREIGEIINAGESIAHVGSEVISAPFKGVLRGMLRSGTHVQRGLKVGDLDPRCEPSLCCLVSDKALAVGGGVLEALLSRREVRSTLGRSD